MRLSLQMKNGFTWMDTSTLWTHAFGLRKILVFHEAPLHTEKIGVWCAVLCSLWDPCFFDSTVDGTVYTDLVKQFVALLVLDEHDCLFQPDSATGLTANKTINILKDIFGSSTSYEPNQYTICMLAMYISHMQIHNSKLLHVTNL